jgi:hypothetical protein
MYQLANTEPPWGDALWSKPACCGGASGVSGWIQDHLWLSLGLAVAAGLLIAKRGKR